MSESNEVRLHDGDGELTNTQTWIHACDAKAGSQQANDLMEGKVKRMLKGEDTSRQRQELVNSIKYSHDYAGT